MDNSYSSVEGVGHRHRWVIALVLGVAMGAGFILGTVHSPDFSNFASPDPLRLDLRFDDPTPGALLEGWTPSNTGIAMAGTTASVQMSLDTPTPTDGDLVLIAEAGKKTTPETLVIVRFNDHTLGHWRLPSAAGTMRRHFTVPHSLINPDALARLSFELVGSAPPSVFSLISLELKNLRVFNANGWVDDCATDKIRGWAVIDGIAGPVSATVDGEALPATSVNYERPTLERSGLPIDAGFEFILQGPIKKGAAVAVQFANGRHLHGSPCRP